MVFESEIMLNDTMMLTYLLWNESSFFSILTTLRCCDDPAERFYGYTLLYNCTCVNSIHICNDRQECSNIVPSQTKRAYSMGMCVKHELDELDALNSIPLRNPFFYFHPKCFVGNFVKNP